MKFQLGNQASIFGKKFYRDSLFATMIRELYQNSSDAGASEIKITWEGNYLIFSDNGRGMASPDRLKVIAEQKENRGENEVGGFDIFHMCWLALEDFKFTSLFGCCDNENDDPVLTGGLESGARFECHFQENDMPYDGINYIKNYISMTGNAITVYLNGEVVEKVKPNSSVAINETVYSVAQDNSVYSQGVLVRINGLPTFFEKTWIPGVVLFDVKTTLNPYDEKYPISTNRDSFRVDSPEYNQFSAVLKSLNDLRAQKEIMDIMLKEEIKPAAQGIVTRGEYKKILTMGDVTEDDLKNGGEKLLALYMRYVYQIHALFNGRSASSWESDNTFLFGLSKDNDDQSRGTFSPSLDKPAFFIDSIVNYRNKAQVLSIALHEYTHYLIGSSGDSHGAFYAQKMTIVTGYVLEAILESNFRK